ncbi:sirohydrochlorin chelatase [Lusitaniella coriacea LEGE 07157]|uniref:Sirohydrochlorin chelatase n=1 Tax=Lusitaniella coriacea LEGE 07157 TaxID=945747 RepID=A0A8J7DXV6_9CYAN|nr:sirohydrochlorin chelatase [Lusitaniella coriacea LEGE 07157]
MTLLSAYLLIFHGSRDPRPQIAAEALAQKVALQLKQQASPSRIEGVARRSTTLLLAERGTALPWVETATLEFATVPLHERIEQFARTAKARGFSQIEILPQFLLSGVHAREDIPQAVAQARDRVGKTIKIKLNPHIGSNPEVVSLLSEKFQQFNTSARILLSHGSRRPGGNQEIETLAPQLGAIPAYWSIAPDLPTQIQILVNAGYPQIGIQPYFLFSGGITDAIARQIQHLQFQFPHAQLLLGHPLGATPELAALIAKTLNS